MPTHMKRPLMRTAAAQLVSNWPADLWPDEQIVKDTRVAVALEMGELIRSVFYPGAPYSLYKEEVDLCRRRFLTDLYGLTDANHRVEVGDDEYDIRDLSGVSGPIHSMTELPWAMLNTASVALRTRRAMLITLLIASQASIIWEDLDVDDLAVYRLGVRRVLWKDSENALQRVVCANCGEVYASDVHEVFGRYFTSKLSIGRMLTYNQRLCVPVCNLCNLHFADNERPELIQRARETYGDETDAMLSALLHVAPRLRPNVAGFINDDRYLNLVSEENISYA